MGTSDVWGERRPTEVTSIRVKRCEGKRWRGVGGGGRRMLGGIQERHSKEKGEDFIQ